MRFDDFLSCIEQDIQLNPKKNIELKKVQDQHAGGRVMWRIMLKSKPVNKSLADVWYRLGADGRYTRAVTLYHENGKFDMPYYNKEVMVANLHGHLQRYLPMPKTGAIRRAGGH